MNRVRVRKLKFLSIIFIINLIFSSGYTFTLAQSDANPVTVSSSKNEETQTEPLIVTAAGDPVVIFYDEDGSTVLESIHMG